MRRRNRRPPKTGAGGRGPKEAAWCWVGQVLERGVQVLGGASPVAFQVVLHERRHLSDRAAVIDDWGCRTRCQWQWSDTLEIREVRPARGGPTHTLEARRWREEKERPLAMIWKKIRKGREERERANTREKGRLRRGGDEKSLIRGEQTRQRRELEFALMRWQRKPIQIKILCGL